MQIWYNENMDTIIMGKWIEKRRFLFFKDMKYQVEFESGERLILNSPKVLEDTCKFLGENDEVN